MSYAIGIDLGGTKVAAGVVGPDGAILRCTEAPYDAGGPETLRDSLVSLVSHLDAPDALGIGIGAAGIIEYPSGRYVYGPNTGLRDLDLGVMLAEAIGRRVVVDNDANCAAWAEHRFGAGRGADHFICVTLGTGIGGGLVLDGKPYRGARGAAAEIGHMLVDPAGPVCGCGRRGCWEQMASGLALQRTAREELVLEPQSALYAMTEGDPSRLSGPMVTEAARSGDGYALRLVDRMARWVGWGLASMVNIFDPDRIAIGGGMARDWDLLQATVVQAMTERVEAPEFRAVAEVVVAELGADAGVVGAALLVLDGA